MSREPVYIVSGFPRSGTSMMMQAVEAGGIETHYSETYDACLKLANNPTSKKRHFELDPNGFHSGMLQKYAGGCIKLLDLPGWIDYAKDNEANIPMRVIYMRRGIEDVKESYREFIGERPGISTAPEFSKSRRRRTIKELRNQKQTESLVTLDYEKVISKPGEQMRKIAKVGWGIKAKKAAEEIIKSR